ncbi:MAG: extracellular solute-binding protein [Anaerolineales bacterium]|jgi:ABC-type glycerol-3-phosphate transport system substrate-binding protein
MEGRNSPLRKIKSLISLGLLLILVLSACEGFEFELPWLTPEAPTATLPLGESDLGTATPVITATTVATPQVVTNLTIWVPPEMDPELDTQATRLFKNQLEAFSAINDNIEIIIRVKAATGVGGLLDALTATSAAAPDALPDLIALTRPDLEMAALKGLIYPLDDLTEIPDDPDWYGFTREMALLQGSIFGFPFAGDALALVYRPATIPELPTTWGELFEGESVFIFPAESDQALFQLALYQAEGGNVQNNQRRPVLDIEPLTEVFRLFQEGASSGNFPESLAQYQTMGQVWSAFREGQADLAIAWVSNYLQDGPADADLTPLFPMAEGAISLGTGLNWAVATPQTNRQSLAVALAEFLVQADYLAEWTEAAGYVPPRPSSLEGWQNQSLRLTVGQVALMTHLQPSNDILTSLGPILQEETRQILQMLVDPAQAAQVAVESLEEQ